MTAGQFAKLWTDKYNSGGATLGGNMMAMQQPMGQGVAMPAGANPMQPINPAMAQMTGLRQAAGIQPQPQPQPQQQPQQQPIASPQMQQQQPAQAPQQQQAAPSPQPLGPQVPLPQGMTDPGQAVMAINREIAKLSANPFAKGQVSALTDWRDKIEESMKPMAVHAGEAMIDPRTGKTIYQSQPDNLQKLAAQRFMQENPNASSADVAKFMQSMRTPQGGMLDQLSLSQMAQQYRAGDTSVMQNIGRGAQGAQNIVALREEVARQNAEAGTSGSDQAMRNAEFIGTKAGERTLGAKQANIEMAATEFKQVLPIVREASLAVSRTNYPDFNKIVQAGEEHTGDPKIVAFGSGVNTLVNLYARAISPTGNPTVSDKDHARDILNKAWSQGQFDSATGMMEKEIDAALNSPQKVRKEMREMFGGGKQDNTSGKQLSPEDAAKLPSGTTFVGTDGKTYVTH
jgi:hypothetical protein